MARDGAFRKIPLLGESSQILHAAPVKPQGFGNGVGDRHRLHRSWFGGCRAAGGRPGHGLWGRAKILPRIGRQMLPHHCGEGRAKVHQLLLAHPGDAGELCLADRIGAGHVPQRDISKNNIRRHPPHFRQFAPQGPQGVEEHVVTINIASFGGRLIPLLRFGRREGTGQGEFEAVLQGFDPLLGHTDGGAHTHCHGLEKTHPRQLAANRLPLGTGHLLADPIGAEVLVILLEDLFVVGPAEDITVVAEAKLPAAGLVGAEHAGKQFLGNEGAIKTFTRGLAVVAAPAVRLRVFLTEVIQ